MRLLKLVIVALLAMTDPAFAAPRTSKDMCTMFSGLSRNCYSVKAFAYSLGEKRAEALARKCGATDQDIEEAKACLHPK